jgi:uncharacterized protein (UPF0262 family)
MTDDADSTNARPFEIDTVDLDERECGRLFWDMAELSEISPSEDNHTPLTMKVELIDNTVRIEVSATQKDARGHCGMISEIFRRLSAGL